MRALVIAVIMSLAGCTGTTTSEPEADDDGLAPLPGDDGAVAQPGEDGGAVGQTGPDGSPGAIDDASSPSSETDAATPPPEDLPVPTVSVSFPVPTGTGGMRDGNPCLPDSAVRLAEGGAVMAGGAPWDAGMCVVWLTATGAASWARSYDLEGSEIRIASIVQVPGGLVLAGNLKRDNSDTQALILSLDDAGELRWVREFGERASGVHDFFFGMIAQGGGAVVVHGSHGGVNATVPINMLYKIDAAGSVSASLAFAYDELRDMLVTGSDFGLTLASGMYEPEEGPFGTLYRGTGTQVLELGGDLAVLSARAYPELGEVAKGIGRSASGDLLLTGTRMPDGAGYPARRQPFLARIGRSGGIVAHHRIATNDDTRSSDRVLELDDGSYVIGGSDGVLGYQRGWILRLSVAGEAQWKRRMAYGPSYLHALLERPLGGLFRGTATIGYAVMLSLQADGTLGGTCFPGIEMDSIGDVRTEPGPLGSGSPVSVPTRSADLPVFTPTLSSSVVELEESPLCFDTE